jgi:hypothetical protein
MPNTRNRRLSASHIQSDRHALIGVQSLPDYTPISSAYSALKLADLQHAMEDAQQAEIRAQQALSTTHDAATTAEWAFHEGVLGAKTQVIAQYGPDSNAVQLLGLKRKSERRRMVRRNGATP